MQYMYIVYKGIMYIFLRIIQFTYATIFTLGARGAYSKGVYFLNVFLRRLKESIHETLFNDTPPPLLFLPICSEKTLFFRTSVLQ